MNRQTLLTKVLPLIGLVLILSVLIVPPIYGRLNPQHCVAHLTPVEPRSGESPVMTELGCYATQEEAYEATQRE
jgi:hypothetical protein